VRRASPILQATERAYLPSTEHIPVLGSFLQATLLNFSPRLIEFIG